jgi:holin-like protein
MLNAITLILLFQVIGEIISRLTGLPVPGPVIGMVLMLMTFFVKDNLIGIIRPTGGVLLTNLSLLFVPAGVGIMRQGERFMTEGVQIISIIVISTIISMLVTAYTIKLSQRLLHIQDN